MSIRAQTERSERRIDSAISDIEVELGRLVLNAQASVMSTLRNGLDLDDQSARPYVKSTSKNVRIIDDLGVLFSKAMEESGYGKLVSEFAGSFGVNIKTFERIMSSISGKLGTKSPMFGSRDVSYFDNVSKATEESLKQVVSSAGQAARLQALMSMNGLPVDKLASLISNRLTASKSDARAIAATGISTFYRTVADNGYQKIEDNLKDTDVEIRYVYMGPPAGDRLIRPFCSKLMTKSEQGVTWNRKQIDAMNNQQIPNVFVTCGGFSCRHQWVIAIEGDTV